MIDQLKKKTESAMQDALVSLSSELKKVRTGRAQVSMLDAIKVNYYGQLSPLNQVSAISCPDARSFLISPWEISILKEIEQAIIKSDLGMTPQSDGKVVRLRLPELTEERRKDLVKSIKKIVEDARVSVRMARRDANELLKSALKEKTISEDENKNAMESIQKITDDFIKKVDQMGVDKETDLMKI
ncbi:MAG: ribosome recycling factor [Bdellovibrionales bacterium RBG_16_40_8]|nr:MAG: ribosome recycling factor [Bdellovibrionales bacterium RBG_16_40_8]